MATMHTFKKEKPLTKVAYEGEIFKVEFFVLESGEVPAEDWLESVSINQQTKFAALFARMGEHGKIYNEQKFKHLTGTDQLFEFKADSGRVLCFFFSGKRIILTHGFTKKSDKTPKREIERAEEYKKDFDRRIKDEG